MSSSPRFRRIATAAVSTVVLLALLVVGTQVQVPYAALGPGPTLNTLGTAKVEDDGKVVERKVVQIDGAPTDPTTGNLNLTTVSVTDGISLFKALGMWLSGTYALTPRDQVYPPDRTTEQVQQDNADQMVGSEENATVAALRYLDRPTALRIASVGPDGPAADVLRAGDEVVEVGGVKVETSAELRKVVAANPPGTVLPLEIVRQGTPETVTVTLAAHPDDQKAGYLGVVPEVVNADPTLDVTYTVGDIGGPSAGMMLALAVIDKLSPGELTHGKFIAGTGTISVDGDVGPIGGITHKTLAARDAGATVFLVPARNCAEATSDRPDGLELIKVETLEGAIDALDAIGDGRPAPTC
ncbi:YlbL family protein [Gordonia jinghuaiqii]|uniref:endopeptidase La n=1 Tax=Gordonia jinghuaiqii TaxID=2758710 RepID=A0A7D7R121_9ACTN|nr:PDZ domain-containing protein [Gordonia jinghuaiqii]QMT00547.1 PDZ domain-containing protein [Gordonia jinghuaiqii]